MTSDGREHTTQGGYTLVELAVVLIIIALISAYVLKGQVFIDSAKSSDVVATTKDLTSAIAAFKERYRYLPGDLPDAHNDLAGIASGSSCDLPIATANIGNGRIDTAAEIGCVSQHLAAAGLLSKAAPDGSFNGVYGRVWIMSREAALSTTTTPCNRTASAGTVLLGTANDMKPTLAVFERVPSEVGKKLDTEFDDGAANTKAVRASAAYAAGVRLDCFGMPVQ